ncbi:NAD kinase [soil metagenome]
MFIGIRGNINKETIGSSIALIVSELDKKNISFALDSELKRVLPKSYSPTLFMPFSKILKLSDIIISIGGDGTFLNTARLVGKSGVPILGINTGNLGFLADITLNEFKRFLGTILNNKFRKVERELVEAMTPDGKILTGLNDIVIDKFDSIRMIEIELIYNEEKVYTCVADGIIVSTPTGSTGYSLSTGGPIVIPRSRVFVISPICPHTLNIRPIVIPDDGKIEIRINTFCKIRITADGQEAIKIDSPASIILKKADHSITLIRRPNVTYFNTLKTKLFWGEDKRKNNNK